MNTLLLYDSTSGYLKELTRVMASELGIHSSVQVIPFLQGGGVELARVDLLLGGCPGMRDNLTIGMRTWLASLPHGSLDGMPVGIFDTRVYRAEHAAGAVAGSLAAELRQRGATVLAPPESFFLVSSQGPLLNGEVGRAVYWVRELLARAQSLSADSSV